MAIAIQTNENALDCLANLVSVEIRVCYWYGNQTDVLVSCETTSLIPHKKEGFNGSIWIATVQQPAPH